MKSRIVLILIALTALWAVVIGRAAYLQLMPDVRLTSLQKKQFETVVTLTPRRGDVFDRNGNELAVSMTTYSLFADPKIIEEPKAVARMLSKVLKMPQSQIDEKMKNKKKRFVWIQRRLEKDVRDRIAEEKIRGLGFIEETQRVYPNDRLLSQVLGFIGGDSQGLEGLELKYNDQLQAARKKVSVARDARGRPLIVNGQIFNQAPDGNDVKLTIDRELQFVLEQELTYAVRHHEADSAVGVVLDAQTSEVLAMASAPSFDPNKPFDFPMDKKRNRAITDSFEPGSTMKTFVIAGALARGVVTPKTWINCENGVMKIGRRTIREADSKHKFASLTVSDILMHSSNVGTTKIAFRMGEKALRETLKDFGFGDKTGIDLPGEQRGIIQGLPWKDHLIANISFGHGVTATPLQMANAYAIIANGGYLKQPYIVKSVHDHETGEIVEGQPKVLRQVLNEDQVNKMKKMLLSVTSDEGTGINARVAGFPVAGKTGTAQKVNPNGRGYLRGGYVSSFGGFIPANDPRFVIYVAVDHPRKDYYGSTVAAPVFSKVASFAVRRAGLEPTLIDKDHIVPIRPLAQDVEGFNLDGASNFSESGKVAEAKSTTKEVVPAVAKSAEAEAAEPRLGDLEGLTLREVLTRLTGTGIKINVKGEGFVTKTQPAAATKMAEAKEITVYLGH